MILQQKATLRRILMLVCLIVAATIPASAIIPLPARIGGTITANGSQLTQTGAGNDYTITVKKSDNSDFIPAARTSSLNSFSAYVINIPIYEPTDQPGGARTGDTVFIHVTYRGAELTVTSPPDGRITVGSSGSITEINLTATTPGTGTTPAISITPASLDFGTVQVGEFSDRAFTVQNIGTGMLSGMASASSPFSVISGGSYNLAANQSQDVIVRFSPTVSQSYNTTVTFTGGTGASRPVTGTGAAVATYTLTTNSNPSEGGTVTRSPNLNSFSSNSQVLLTAVANSGYTFSGWSGDASGIVNSITVTMDRNRSITANFVNSAGGVTISGTIRSGSGQAIPGVNVTFSNGGPSVVSDSNGNYLATVSSGYSGTATPSLSGYTFNPPNRSYSSTNANQTGQDYTGTVTQVPNSGPAIMSVNLSRLDFGSVAVGSYLDLDLTVRNVGGGTLRGNATTTGTPFNVLSGSSYVLLSNERQVVKVRFAPTSNRMYTGDVVFTAADGVPGVAIAVSGTGETPPIISVTPAILDFGSVPAGSYLDLDLTVRNVGGGLLSGNTCFGRFGDMECPQTIATAGPFSILSGSTYSLRSNETQTVRVRFSGPATSGSYVGNIIFTGGGGTARPVSGNGGISCTFTIAPLSRSHDSTGGTGTIQVSTSPGCTWSALSTVNWITISDRTGTGDRTIGYSIEANTTTTERSGGIVVGGKLVTIAQISGPGASCTFAISPLSRSHDSAGGSGTIQVNTSSGCTWTANADVSWITVTPGSPSTDSGTVRYTVSANANPNAREGHIVVRSQTFTVTQSGNGCTYTISPTSRFHSALAENGSINVATQSGCTWSATSNASWIAFGPGASGTGERTGNLTISYGVSANPTTSQRAGTITIADQIFSVTQACTGCTTSASTLNFPRLFTTAELASTGFALVNPSDADAPVSFKLYDASGREVGSSAESIPSGGQLARLGSDLFRGTLSGGWVQATTSVRGVQGAWLGGDFLTHTDGAEAAQEFTDQIFPVLNNRTEISIVNPGTQPITITVRLRGPDGIQITSPVTRVLEGRGAFQSQVSSMFGVDVGFARSTILITSTGAFAGTSVVQGFLVERDTAVINGTARMQSNSPLELNFPHVVSGPLGGDNYTAGVAVTNLSSGTNNITITFTEQSNGHTTTQMHTLPGDGFIWEFIPSFREFRNGWLKITGTAAFSGLVTYSVTGGGIAMVPPQSSPQTSILFGHIADLPPWYTGVALLNATNTDALVEIYAMTPEGTLIGGATNVATARFTLPARSKTARLLSDLIPQTQSRSSDGGFVFVRSTNGVPLYGVELFFLRNLAVFSNVAGSGLPSGMTYTPPTLPPTDGATFVSEAIPNNTVVGTGQNFAKTWTLRNSGTTTWNSSYSLQYVSGNAGCSHSAIPVIGRVMPNASYTFTVNCTAPIGPDTYREDWQLMGPSGTISVSGGSTIWMTVATQTNNIWTEKAPFPPFVGIRAQLSFSIGNKGYLGIPCFIGSTCAGQFWEYDPVANKWTQLRNHPNITAQSPVFVLDATAYVISGTHVWQYTRSSDSWIQKRNIPGVDKRAGFGFSLVGRGYVGGGFYNGGALWEYDPSNDIWTRKNDHPMLQIGSNDPTVRSIEAVTFTIGNKAYLTGTNSLFWEYSPDTDTWVTRSYVDAVRGQAFSIGSNGYVFNTHGSLYEYDVTHDQWKHVGVFPGQTVCYPAGFAIGSSLYVGVGGRSTANGCQLDIVNTWWEFHP